MGLLSYMRYVVDRNAGTWRMSTPTEEVPVATTVRRCTVRIPARKPATFWFASCRSFLGIWGYDAVLTGDSLHWRHQATTTDVSEQPITPSSELNQEHYYQSIRCYTR